MFESENDDGAPFLFESAENQDSRSETPDTNNVDGPAHTHTLDKAGFIHQATSDIPKTSMEYSLPSFTDGIDVNFSSDQTIHEESQEGVDKTGDPLDQNQNESSQLSTQLCDMMTFDKHKQSDYLAEQTGQPSDSYTGEHGADYSQLNGYGERETNNTSQSPASRDFTFCRDDGDKCVTSQVNDAAVTQPGESESLTTMEELFKELSQEAKMITQQFSSGFVQSAEYEEFCMTRLDQLIAHAKELEQVYIKQKEVLRQRLRVISHTLQNM